MSTTSELVASVNAATVAMMAKVNVKADSAFLTDNALKLGNKTAANLVADANANTSAHAQNGGNPHNVTPAQLNAYASAQIDDLIRSRVPRGLLPLARWGTFSADAEDSVVFYSSNNSPTTISFVSALCMINGTDYTLPAQTINLPANTKTLVYFALVAGVPKYVTSATPLAETNTRMYIGAVNTNNTSIIDIDLKPVIRLGMYRLSTTPAGSAIPVSAGNPADPAALIWK